MCREESFGETSSLGTFYPSSNARLSGTCKKHRASANRWRQGSADNEVGRRKKENSGLHTKRTPR